MRRGSLDNLQVQIYELKAAGAIIKSTGCIFLRAYDDEPATITSISTSLSGSRLRPPVSLATVSIPNCEDRQPRLFESST
jgi:hypothetical protein